MLTETAIELSPIKSEPVRLFLYQIFLLISKDPLSAKPRRISDDDWMRNLRALMTYAITDQTQEMIAEKLNVSHQAIPQLLRRTIRQLYVQAGDEIHERFTLEQLIGTESLDKHLGMREILQFERRVRKLRAEGLRGEELLQALRVTQEQYQAKVNKAIKMGIVIPALFNVGKHQADFIVAQIAALLASELHTARLQELVAQITTFHAYRRHSDQSKNPNSPLVKLCDILPEATIPGPKAYRVVEVLRRNGVVVGQVDHQYGKSRYIQRHYFIARQQRQLARAILESQVVAEILTVEIKKVWGPEVEMPNSTELMNPDKYKHLKVAFQKAGIVRDPKVKYETFFGLDCPVAIFHYQKSYYYAVEDEQELVEYLEKRKKI